VATFAIHFVVYAITGLKAFIWLHFLTLGLSLFCWRVFGLNDYSKFTKSGPFRVGVKDFKTDEFSNDCTIFYPAANDGSGNFGVPFLNYGED
jgi:hypothetical protein